MTDIEFRDGRPFRVVKLPDDPALATEQDSIFQRHRKRGKRRPYKFRKRPKKG